VTQDHARIFAKLLNAYASGRTVQCNTHGDWVDGKELTFGLSPDHYRIKPELHDFTWAVQQVRDETGYVCRDSEPTLVLAKAINGAIHYSLVGTNTQKSVTIQDALATDWRFHNNGE